MGEENLRKDEFSSTIHLFCVTLGMQSSRELSSWLFQVIIMAQITGNAALHSELLESNSE